MIEEKFYNGEARILQKEIVERIMAKNNITSETLFKNHYLDFEYLYIDAGWGVEFNNPGYNETYKAYFIFSKKVKK